MQMTGSLARLLNQYINDELYDFHYYMEVAKKVDKPEAKRMIEEIACDEYQHARLLTDYYVRLTGTMPTMTDFTIEPISNDLEQVYLARVVSETSDMKKWKCLYLSTGDPWLRDIAFNNMVDESQHATRLLYLVEQGDEEAPAQKGERYICRFGSAE